MIYWDVVKMNTKSNSVQRETVIGRYRSTVPISDLDKPNLVIVVWFGCLKKYYLLQKWWKVTQNNNLGSFTKIHFKSLTYSAVKSRFGLCWMCFPTTSWSSCNSLVSEISHLILSSSKWSQFWQSRYQILTSRVGTKGNKRMGKRLIYIKLSFSGKYSHPLLFTKNDNTLFFYLSSFCI